MFLPLREMDASQMVDLSLRGYLLHRPFTIFVVTVFITFVRLQATREAMMRRVARD